MSAVTQVLDTYELLEPVITLLPPKQMFTVQAVSESWHSIITRSSKIQRLMFRLPRRLPLTPVVSGSRLSNVRMVSQYDEELEFNCLTGGLMRDEVWPSETEPSLCITVLVFEKKEQLKGVKPQASDDLFFTQPPCTTACMYVEKFEGK